MKFIEKGKTFKEKLTIEELNEVKGGVFCIGLKDCDSPLPQGGTREDTCTILIGCTDRYDK